MDIQKSNVGRERQSKRTFFNKNILMLLVSLAIGGGGVYLAKEFIEKKINYYKSQLEKTEEMVSLVVPKRNMTRGTTVSVKDFSIRNIPKKFAHTNAVTQSTMNTAIGQRLSFDITKGKALLWAHLEGGLMPTFSGKIEEGKRALSFTVDKINSISGFLQPKDKIDLLLEYNNQIIPVIQNLHVVATGTRTRIDKTGAQGANSYSIITVDVTPEVAEKIILATSLGKITAILRSPLDDKPMSDAPMTVAKLFNKPKPKVVRKKRIVQKKQGIEFIIGGR
ncbi:MAG: Flp pilus assembly protein CpaB [Candidatus Thiodiazotropha sp.]